MLFAISLRTTWRCGTALLAAALAGCGTTRATDTSRTATEQLLISSAVDLALSEYNFQPLAGRVVFVETKFVDCVDKNYVIAALRHRLLATGAKLVEKADEADVIIEIRTGAVGTDRQDLFVGVPRVPLLPLTETVTVSVPELPLLKRTAQRGAAKIGLVAYERRTSRVTLDGAISLARTDSQEWSMFGVVPWQRGSVHDEMATAATPETTSLVDIAKSFVPRAFVPEESPPAKPADDVAPAVMLGPPAQGKPGSVPVILVPFPVLW